MWELVSRRETKEVGKAPLVMWMGEVRVRMLEQEPTTKTAGVDLCAETCEPFSPTIRFAFPAKRAELITVKY